MKKAISILAVLALALCVAAASADGAGSEKREETPCPGDAADNLPECVEPILTEDAPQAYILHVKDQNGDPVPGVYFIFCTDAMCVPVQSDENGTAVFVGVPGVYHVQILRVPDGYGFDAGFEMITERAYGEWLLRVVKN